MQASPTFPTATPKSTSSQILRKLGWFLAVPILFLLTLTLTLSLIVTLYQAQHQDRIFTGVSVWGIELSQKTQAEAEVALTNSFPYAQQTTIFLIDPANGQEWRKTPADLGVSLDLAATIQSAYQVGRNPDPAVGLESQFKAWYYGQQVAPVIVIDESKLEEVILEISAGIEQPPIDATLNYDGNQVSYTAPQIGRILDRVYLRQKLLQTLSSLSTNRIELQIIEISPRVLDTSSTANAIQQIIGSPMTFYLQEPLADVDLGRVEISVAELTSWLLIQTSTNANGVTNYQVSADENGIRNWLTKYEPLLYREPVNARFYFNDTTRELVVVEPHVSGRALDVEATVAEFMQHVATPNRSVPFLLKEIIPLAHAGATAQELGITELVSESTTWFWGSPSERKHNIARAASNFYGIVVAPGETFSFNKYLGDISEEDGYETGLIIWGGRTIEGVGGGVCQVSTTLYQSAFWAGFPIVERWAHGYQVGYYDDGEGPGMDATVFSPIIDFQFVNNTPYHLLIENYFNETNQSLWFKFYSTSMGRTVEKEGPLFDNVRPPKPDIWEFNDKLAEGEIKQMDWAVEGADVTVYRTVYNQSGEIILEDTFVSNYIPWQNIYEYGPGVTLP